MDVLRGISAIALMFKKKETLSLTARPSLFLASFEDMLFFGGEHVRV